VLKIKSLNLARQFICMMRLGSWVGRRLKLVQSKRSQKISGSVEAARGPVMIVRLHKILACCSCPINGLKASKQGIIQGNPG
jgi:hypothetical protein